MKKLLPLIALILILCLTMSSSAFTEAPVRDTGVYMWQITPQTGSSANNSLYLLGSLSVSDKSIFPLDDRIEKAYSQCSRLIVESDGSKITQEQTVVALLKYGLLSKTTIDKVLSKEQYDKANSLIEKYTQNKKSLSTYKNFMPWVIENLITNLAFSTSKDLVQNGAASYFIQEARKEGKSIVELESLDSQLSTLASTPYSYQGAVLENTIDFINKETDTVKNATELWKNGDVQGLSDLYSLKNLSMKGYDKQILDRNKKTADYLVKCIKSGGKYFAVVEASGLTGENNIISLLNKLGYKAEQM
ncbi:MAG TPA: TraB/GumN family protein [Ruminiclostridium sp.]|nr:TraB/GumN family protein [Ruminiclostridium sp.]